MVSSIGVAIISIFLLTYFKFIPLAVIAAILVYVAIQMVETHHFIQMFRYDKQNLAVSLFVATITIVEDPIVGILFGVGAASLLLLEKISRGQFDLMLNANKKIIGRISGEKLDQVTEHSDTIVYSFKGLVCYLNSESHLNRFRNSLNGSKHIILRLRSVYYMDMDGVDTINEIVHLTESLGKKVYLTSISPMIVEMMEKSQAYQNLQSKGRVFNKSSDALRSLGFKIPVEA
jgi:SulP family sulfate permease